MPLHWRRLFLVGHLIAFATLGSACGQLYDYPEVTPEQSAQSCSDDLDNDLDGRTDCEDSECAAFCDESSEATCQDGEDNDQDGESDCNDVGCAEFCPEANAPICSDQQDNDFDGDIDCNDDDCEGFCPEETAADCTDGLDNDGDGLSDTADPRCWLHSPPKVERCAQTSGVKVIETFDAGLSNEWSAYGFREVAGISERIIKMWSGLEMPLNRRDDHVLFGFKTSESQTLDNNLGVLVKQRAFSGAWAEFELSFSAAVPLGTVLRASVVPIDLAPDSDPPRPGAETASVTLTLDAASSSPTITLDVEGVASAKALPIRRTLCTTATSDCEENWARVEVRLDPLNVRAGFALPNGESVEVRGPMPSSSILSPSRLVFWGGSTDRARYSELDDLRLSVLPSAPCGFSTPQIPGASCEYSGSYSSFGHTVAMAQNGEGGFCALVTASREAGSVSPDDVTAWQSEDGAIWSLASSAETRLELLGGAPLLGAGIAHGGSDWQVVVMYRDGEAKRLGFTEGKHCGVWGPLKPGPTLFDDAEPPSYVMSEGREDVYFSRPPTDQVRRTLWRLALGASEMTSAEPELLAELPAGAGAPITVQRLGARDRVLTYPSAPGTSPAGVGVLVADEDERSWRSVDSAPLLILPESLPSLNGPFSFDDRGAVSSALSWGPKGGILLYGGASLVDPNEPPVFAAGTARVVPADQTFPAPVPELQRGCGDAICDSREDCTSCPTDCACGGVELLADVFTKEAPWEVVSDGTLLEPPLAHYIDAREPILNWAGGPPTWSVLPLGLPISADADFELSFDFLVSADRYHDEGISACTVHVGLGPFPSLTRESLFGGTALTPNGIFARFTQSAFCIDRYLASPVVAANRTLFGEAETILNGLCSVDHALAVGNWQHVTLRREGAKISVLVPQRDGCGTAERIITYSGAPPELANLLIGFGGEPLSNCWDLTGAGSVANLRLRLLDVPSVCPEGKQRCNTDLQAPTCVDISDSHEHCGSCGQACGAHQTCVMGSCVCAEVSGILECEGSCIDSLTSNEHCGACGNVCYGICAAGSCAVPDGCRAPPIVILPEASEVTLDFSKQSPQEVVLCEARVYGLLILSWVPPVSGTAVIEAIVDGTDLDTVLGIDTSTKCASWSTCNDDAVDLGLGSRVTLPVVAGTQYVIGAGLIAGDLSSPATLRIRVE